jgi:hypothetical protein
MKMKLATLMETPPWEWPGDTGATLLEILRNDRASEDDLRAAAELAGNLVVMNDELANALLSIVGDNARSEEVRGRAAIALGPVLEQADTHGFEEDEVDTDLVPITERTFQKIQQSLRKLYLDDTVPTEVRRRILEASVRAPEEWHSDAIRAAYASDDELWKLTAVFCMRYVRGFDEQILEALESKNADIHYEAVVAAGDQSVEEAWSHVSRLVTSRQADKPLRLAAIEAIASIRPSEATEVLAELTDSDDEEIAEAAQEALAIAEGFSDEGDELDEDDENDELDEEEDGDFRR